MFGDGLAVCTFCLCGTRKSSPPREEAVGELGVSVEGSRGSASLPGCLT